LPAENKKFTRFSFLSTFDVFNIQKLLPTAFISFVAFSLASRYDFKTSSNGTALYLHFFRYYLDKPFLVKAFHYRIYLVSALC